LIRALTEKGVAIIYVSHKMDEIFRIADRITVLRDGKLIACNRASETNITELIAMMVGRELPESERRAVPEATRLLLRVQSLRTVKLRDISFDLHAGEVLGVAGLVGSGRRSLGPALLGLDPILGGGIEFRGRPFHPKSPADAMKRGLGLVPEDRKSQGLMMQMSVLENSSLSVLDRIQSFGFLRRAEEQREGSEVHRRLRLENVSPYTTADMPAGKLSGGNQQKVLLSRWLWRDPEVLFLDDPARGIDIGAKHDIYKVLDELSAAGKSILLASSELPELLRCSDRILVLAGGESKGILQRAEATQERIMALAANTGAAV
jgi:ABC-type sugar transport system ATPase subunit